MTKVQKHFIAAAVALLTLGGCTNDEPAADSGKESPDFTATIGSVNARAHDNSWEQNDRIGISTGEHSNISHITKAGDGIFTVEDSKNQIYFKDDKDVTFTAYYPWKALTGGVKITADTKEQSGQKAFDFLWAQAKGSKNEPTVKFNFSHKMAKVVLTVSKGSNMSDEEFKSTGLSFGGIIHSGSFDIVAGSTKADGSVENEWNFAESITAADKVTYTFILFPQEFKEKLVFLAKIPQAAGEGSSPHELKGEIDFTAANRVKDNDNAKNEMVAGRQYTLSVTLQKTGVTFDGCVITDWEKADVGDIKME